MIVKPIFIYSSGLMLSLGSINLALLRVHEDSLPKSSFLIAARLSNKTQALLSRMGMESSNELNIVFPTSCQSCSYARFPKARKLDGNFLVANSENSLESEWCKLNACLSYSDFHLEPNLPVNSSTILRIRGQKVTQVFESSEEINGVLSR